MGGNNVICTPAKDLAKFFINWKLNKNDVRQEYGCS